jgi:copper chaperone CopZ
MIKYKLTISGMHCASCANNIERSLKTIKGVKSVSVSIMLKKASVEAEENVKEDELKKAVSRAGYNVIGLEKVK